MIIHSVVNDLNHPIIGAALDYELDEKAERFALLDRNTLRIVAHKKANGIGRLFVPYQYAGSEGLSMIIFDDHGQFNAEIADHIKASYENMK
ncbi:hypothetical protein N473_26425 [Pseudoalteromonas luteoviolacea CPMOR-1]|uniref:Uncharacterized protein n=1 Tax=Pseudoalteromonas luteoviolacea CPMOR-1 TaxID=1365248 RepID=A0A167HRL6_9GAMM|nr:hypothetical protein [Pseudoalteromonas luteoviolacea]KZN58447.1 hypothetical protein N473_26425 [Pseudoalteromonas luteoviolacea CPMOR-1]